VSVEKYGSEGLLERYEVRRKDGQPEDPGARFFVLRFDKDDFWGQKCREALRSFAYSIRAKYPKLTDDLLQVVATKGQATIGEPGT